MKYPYYSNYDNLFYYKVISEKLMVKVTIQTDGQCQTELTQFLISSAFRKDATQIEAPEFREALIKATQIIVNS